MTIEFVNNKKNNNSYLPCVGRGNPSKDHSTLGVGLPAALHFNETAGPGCKVCSMKLYNNVGGASINLKFSLNSFLFRRQTSCVKKT